MAECRETRDIVRKNFNDLKEVFDDDNLHSTLLAITRKLKVKIRWVVNGECELSREVIDWFGERILMDLVIVFEWI